MAEKTIFKKIIDKEIPADVVYEDDLCLAFRDIAPQAPTHIIVIPKKELRSTNDITEEDAPLIGHLYCVMNSLARKEGIDENGYRIVTNCGPDACQTVPHLHYHLIGGRKFGWPPG